MSNFSDIGFSINSDEEFQELLEKTYPDSTSIKVKDGAYAVYADESGGELWMQISNEQTCIGVNPHYKGKSRRKVCLTRMVERPNPLDGGFYCWAAPANKLDPQSGLYPFVFDAPDFRILEPFYFPADVEIQLTAFAQQVQLFESEAAFAAEETTEPKFAVQSFIPSGLFADAESEEEAGRPEAYGFFTGIIKQVERKRNALTRHIFYALLVETLGGEIDVVADAAFFDQPPVVNGVIQAECWLSGQIITRS
ncbi:hypothetical protein [Chitinophaga qingshengii]|uniref:Uncharacterized protein n=1 Tax=Chitinophaga qingshengii TaxID=1569794 RepID=A0ABR7TKM2_9BACT|nr:hypothetical protein [Chitinophaga qingshengii]MBC9931040.1 hypothetical protein [Chitinophaga qingshengii]